MLLAIQLSWQHLMLSDPLRKPHKHGPIHPTSTAILRLQLRLLELSPLGFIRGRC